MRTTDTEDADIVSEGAGDVSLRDGGGGAGGGDEGIPLRCKEGGDPPQVNTCTHPSTPPPHLANR